MSETKRRLEAIEARIPRAVRLTLDDGTVLVFPQGPLRLFNEIVEQQYAKRTTGKEGPLLSIVRRAVKSENFGRKMLELAKAVLG